MPLKIAIIGAGPSGFYTADALLRRSSECLVDIIEALPTPYGLIRGGVAPDHQSTKLVSRFFAKIAGNARVTYFGNVSVGRDVALDRLRRLYDAVVIAVGATEDRPLGVPGADLPGVYGSGDFVGWYNGHPDYRDLNPDLEVSSAVIIGNGNVAIDIARILAKSEAEMAESDLAAHAATAIHRAPLEDIYIVGRRGPSDSKFTNKELSELGELAQAAPLVDPGQLPEQLTGEMTDHERLLREKNLATFRDFAVPRPAGALKRVHFLFHAQPLAVSGTERVTSVRLERTRVEAGRALGTGEVLEISCGLILSAIGYRMRPFIGLELDRQSGVLANQDGRIEQGLYAVGWARRGPSGVIGTNKEDGEIAAQSITAEVTDQGRPGGTGLRQVLEEGGARPVSFDDWLKIDGAEIAAATGKAPRRKFARVQDMLDAIER